MLLSQVDKARIMPYPENPNIDHVNQKDREYTNRKAARPASFRLPILPLWRYPGRDPNLPQVDDGLGYRVRCLDGLGVRLVVALGDDQIDQLL